MDVFDFAAARGTITALCIVGIILAPLIICMVADACTSTYKGESMVKKILIPVVIVVFLAIIFIGNLVSVNDQAVYMENNIDATGQNTVISKKNVETNVNLIESYVKEDSALYASLIDAFKEVRDADYSDQSISIFLNALRENYPDVSAHSSIVSQAMDKINSIAPSLAKSRTEYNQYVSEYKSFCNSMVHRMLLNMSGYETKNFQYIGGDIEYTLTPTSDY